MRPWMASGSSGVSSISAESTMPPAWIGAFPVAEVALGHFHGTHGAVRFQHAGAHHHVGKLPGRTLPRS